MDEIIVVGAVASLSNISSIFFRSEIDLFFGPILVSALNAP